MAQAAPFISLALGGLSFFQQMDAADQQKELAREAQAINERNAIRAEKENMETERRAYAQNEREEATARARAAASGVDPGSGSMALYQDTLRDENQRELDWLRESGESRVDIIRREGDYTYRMGLEDARQTRAGAYGDLFDSGDTFGTQMGWWGS